MTTSKTLTPMQQLDNAIAILASGEVRQGCALVYQAARAAVDAAAARHGIACTTHLDAYNFILALDGIAPITSYYETVNGRNAIPLTTPWTILFRFRLLLGYGVS